MKHITEYLSLLALLPAAAFASYISETVTVSKGWNAVYIESTPENPDAAAFFADLACYFLFATNAAIRTFLGVPQLPHVSWQVSAGGFATFAPVSAPVGESMLSTTYFGEGPCGATHAGVPHSVWGSDPVAPSIAPVNAFNRKPKVEGGKVYAFESDAAGEWPGVIDVATDLGGLDFSDGVAKASVIVRNAGTQEREVRLSLADSAREGDVRPQLFIYIPPGAASRSSWTEFASTNVVLSAGESRTFVFQCDKSAMTDGTNYAAVLAVEDLSGTKMRVRLPVSATKDAVREGVGAYPAGLWIGQAQMMQVSDVEGNLKNAGGSMKGTLLLHVDGSGRMTVELELSQRPDKKISKGALAREVSKCCGRRFDLPALSCEGGRVRAAMCEMPLYDVEIGTDQHIADGGKLCGDCIDYFSDGMGSTYALVCDGMGTGGRAAVDGNMAVSVMGRLLRSGLSPDSSLQIANSALMIKSGDESLSTVDLAGVDLFTGGVTLKKAGAPLTYIKKGGRLLTREMPSLPAGILNNIKFSTDTIKLGAGDMIVMVSDGVITGDEKWLERLIRSWNEGSAQDLAQAVVQEAIRRRAQTRDDDITAVAIRLVES